MKKPKKERTEAEQRERFRNQKHSWDFETIKRHRQLLNAQGYKVSLDPSEDI